ncbi:MAG TPA: transposase [Candidatus Paenibacillus intestinavium]|nr:transposase [Candidatus Paenibacillus intestinavium]
MSEDSYTCPNNKKVAFVRHTIRKDKTGFQRDFKLYECEDCTDCPFRLDCTKAEAGVNRKLMVNERWEEQKAYVRTKLSEEETGAIYRQRKIDVEPVFAFL